MLIPVFYFVILSLESELSSQSSNFLLRQWYLKVYQSQDLSDFLCSNFLKTLMAAIFLYYWFYYYWLYLLPISVSLHLLIHSLYFPAKYMTLLSSYEHCFSLTICNLFLLLHCSVLDSVLMGYLFIITTKSCTFISTKILIKIGCI